MIGTHESNLVKQWDIKRRVNAYATLSDYILKVGGLYSMSMDQMVILQERSIDAFLLLGVIILDYSKLLRLLRSEKES